MTNSPYGRFPNFSGAFGRGLIEVVEMEAYDRTSRRLHHLAVHLGQVVEDRARARTSFDGGLSVQPCSVSGGWDNFQRRDNRTLFARQSTDDQAQFARQAPAEVGEAKEQKNSHPSSATPSRSVANDVSNPYGGIGATPTKPSKVPADDERDHCFATVEPLFGRPAPESEDVGTKVPDTAGFEWFPRMDVVESGMAYVVTVELPGVCADGIHVEIVRSSLIVTGSRATEWWKSSKNGSNGGNVSRDAVYHLRELAQGPYRAVWRLPKNSDVNAISAEFINGFLRILVPKIKVTTYL